MLAQHVGSWVEVQPHVTLGKLSAPCASVTKQYNFVPFSEQCCSVAGKVTMVWLLALHSPCVTDFSGMYNDLLVQGLGRGCGYCTYAPEYSTLHLLR